MSGCGGAEKESITQREHIRRIGEQDIKGWVLVGDLFCCRSKEEAGETIETQRTDLKVQTPR